MRILNLGDAPVIPGCSAETIFGTTGDIVPSGCNVCIPEGNSVTLDCSSASESPVSYRWTDDYGNLLSTSERLRVSVPGNYTCTALNVDNPSVISATALFCKLSYLSCYVVILTNVQVMGELLVVRDYGMPRIK